MPSRLAQLYREHFDTLVEETIVRIINEAGGMYAVQTPEQLRPRVIRALDLLGRDLELESGEEPHNFGQNFVQISYDRARQGYTIDDLQRVIGVLIDVAHRFCYQQIEDAGERLAVIEHLLKVDRMTRSITFKSFVRAREEVILEQADVVRQLSSPIIPIYQGVLVLPLIGTIDAQRAAQIMENLLNGIAEHQADVVIVDITGVPVIDSSVANYILQAARAAQLLGSQVLLVGIGAKVARTIVQIGIDMRTIVTRANLQDGLEYALTLLGVTINHPDAVAPLHEETM